MADKARAGTRPPKPRVQVADPRDDGPDIGVEARLAAGVLLNAALEGRGGLDAALTFREVADLPGPDRAFARAVAMAALRRLGEIDQILDRKLQKAPPLAVRTILRVALAQTLVLETPAFAAVSTAVKLAEREVKTRPYKNLVNAVLRGIEREGPGLTTAESNLPEWLAARWRATYGEATLLGLALAAREEPATDLSLKPEVDATAVAEALDGEVMAGDTVRTGRRGDLATWPGFEDGVWWVQDAAAAVPVRLLAPKARESIVDFCAAPGGKTLQIAASGASVVALDRSDKRLDRLRANLARTGLSAEVVAVPAEDWEDPRAFDAVLLDAPCTATGTFRRNPEVLRATKPADVAKLADVQHRLLDAAAGRVKPGGRLVYCVCSLEREEGETQIIAFLRRNPAFRTAPADPAAVGAPEQALTPEGWLRILPSMWAEKGGLDGFFIARLDRAG
ncbi:MAG: RsmB/NOP family class I SAM-dependent RNA methyltransferase [Alphaproteobacteria bacterium]|jgi:16S rRNA (cytosine967-C5)-methyltransferase|nr:RsmB/NOP family class I SAM-dependent RNA methyltransferase [Alphaproteobacteria bacterium]MBU2041294.1 RsmB/NOP family class I SAM-dependent RNA methyltransferase [Alphaproteobacteria bacterium]MBU2124722.1 RsmB/NOP family class I SAM-dependent RNA methyltransferase [Alphaproteobacteria bacterium]MBU2208569.1 RsmB/NOP family class I SAM-dependent RNA methyltransferase [Alphaproteobacteria bacterium]MBU2397935.1 RsmB/NOP family class I SAM-dependent RNA methyltransferase [Alphaproteobacteria